MSCIPFSYLLNNKKIYLYCSLFTRNSKDCAIKKREVTYYLSVKVEVKKITCTSLGLIPIFHSFVNSNNIFITDIKIRCSIVSINSED